MDDLASNGKASYRRDKTDSETVIGSTLDAGKNITVAALQALNKDGSVNNDQRGNVTIDASSITSRDGKIVLAGDKNVTIKEQNERRETYRESRTVDEGFFSTTVKVKKDDSVDNAVKGSTISGATVTVASGKDVTVRGSNVVGSGDVSLSGRENVTISSAQETIDTETYRYSKTSGIFGSGVGITIGSQSQKNDIREQGVNQIGSTVGSTNGTVTVASGKDVAITASDIIGEQGVNLSGRNITVQSADNSANTKETDEFKQSGLSIAVGNKATEQLGNAIHDASRSSEVTDSRLKALYDYKGYNDARDALNSSKAKPGLNLTVSLGSSSRKSETDTQIISAQGSNVTSNGNVTLKATDGNLAVIGSTVSGANER